MNELKLLPVLFGYHTNNNNQQNAHHSKTMMIHCRLCNVIMFNDVCICLYVSILAHTQTNNNTTTSSHRQQPGTLWSDEENDGKKERERKWEKEWKKWNEGALCTTSTDEGNEKNETYGSDSEPLLANKEFIFGVIRVKKSRWKKKEKWKKKGGEKDLMSSNECAKMHYSWMKI